MSGQCALVCVSKKRDSYLEGNYFFNVLKLLQMKHLLKTICTQISLELSDKNDQQCNRLSFKNQSYHLIY